VSCVAGADLCREKALPFLYTTKTQLQSRKILHRHPRRQKIYDVARRVDEMWVSSKVNNFIFKPKTFLHNYQTALSRRDNTLLTAGFNLRNCKFFANISFKSAIRSSLIASIFSYADFSSSIKVL
jgi:hypothetical protein